MHFFPGSIAHFNSPIRKIGSCKPQKFYKSQMYIGTIWLELDKLVRGSACSAAPPRAET
jgi:hypothetical protein